MALPGRIARAEAGLSETLLWRQAERIAAETGGQPEALVAEATAILRKYRGHFVTLPGGQVDIAPALRAVAEGEGLDYEELAVDARRALRNLRARQRRQGR
ncbi:MAG: hypothetical protein GEU75_06925 [Dehalococcoidia bacterium]|nr:hypothetical protein [Dehalococcoidia bacterium]